MTETADRRLAQAKGMSNRHKTYQFMFATATAHELTHLFVAYLAQGDTEYESYTPPEVSYLNYGKPTVGDELALGESGRWLESRLFGGSIECYRDRNDPDQVFGTPHVLDPNAVSQKVHFECVRRFVENARQFQFPFVLEGARLTTADRLQLGVVSLGGSQTGAPQPVGRLLMRARDELPRNILVYNVPGSELQQAAMSARPIEGAQMVTA